MTTLRQAAQAEADAPLLHAFLNEAKNAGITHLVQPKNAGITHLVQPKEAMQMALDALQSCAENTENPMETMDALNALRTALEAPEQEPVGYVFEKRDFIGSVIGAKGAWAPHETPLYAAPVEAPDIEALTKERDALMAAGKIALNMCVEFSRAPMTQVGYLGLLRVIASLKQAGVQ